jgi:precorrin-2/cobalt-factor-2 C20-methyltransferase
MTRVLTGVGMGPGDPQLVTVAAVEVLRTADVVLVPVADTGEEGRAEAIVRQHVDRPLRRVEFALTDDAGRAAAWDAAGRVVVDAFGEGHSTVAFATIGDPNVYSTFTYLAQTVRAIDTDVEVRTVPGITAMQALASQSGTVLVEGRESLVLLPLTAGVHSLREALHRHDTVVAYKGGRVMPQVLQAVREAGRIDTAVYAAALGREDQVVRPAAELDPDRAAPYLSTLVVTSPRGERGAQL